MRKVINKKDQKEGESGQGHWEVKTPLSTHSRRRGSRDVPRLKLAQGTVSKMGRALGSLADWVLQEERNYQTGRHINSKDPSEIHTHTQI